MSFTWEHVLYRFYDENGALLYVGITNSINRRFIQHAGEKPWWSDIVDCRIAFYPDRASLARAETDAIKYEGPRYNIRQETPVPRIRRIPRPQPVALPIPVGGQRAAHRWPTVTDDEFDFLHYRGKYAGTATKGA